jgi:kynurenine formamidase
MRNPGKPLPGPALRGDAGGGRSRAAGKPDGEIGMCVPGCQDTVRHALTRRGLFRGAAAAGFAATAVSLPEPAAAQVPRRAKALVDLTHTMSPEFPTFFGVPGIELQKQFDLKKDGFNLNWWRIIEHAGTHIDAPIHFSEGGASVDKLLAETLVVPLAVVDVRGRAAQNADYQLSRQDLLEWEKKNRRLPDGCCVAMLSGWASHVGDPAKYSGAVDGVFHFPGFAPEAADWLIAERKVWGLAVDTLSLDHGTSKDFKTHVSWLGAGRWGLENVAALDNVPASGATLIVGLAKVKGATGGPTRLFALV